MSASETFDHTLPTFVPKDGGFLGTYRFALVFPLANESTKTDDSIGVIKLKINFLKEKIINLLKIYFLFQIWKNVDACSTLQYTTKLCILIRVRNHPNFFIPQL